MRCPQQGNGYDCGVFVVIFADLIADFISSNGECDDIHAWENSLSNYLAAHFVSDLPSATRRRYALRIDELKRK